MIGGFNLMPNRPRRPASVISRALLALSLSLTLIAPAAARAEPAATPAAAAPVSPGTTPVPATAPGGVLPDPVIPSAGADRVTRASQGFRSGHAWVAIPALNARGKIATLMHMPARDGDARSAAGTLRRVTELSPAPQALIAQGERVYVIFWRETVGSRAQGRRSLRRVVSFDTSPIAGGYWDYAPMPGGRSEPALTGDGELVDACVTPLGPSVLLAPIAGEQPTTPGLPASAVAWRLVVLDRSAWTDVAFPPELAGATWVRLIDDMLLAQLPGEADARSWRLVPPKPAPAPTAPPARASNEAPAAPVEVPSTATTAEPAAPQPTFVRIDQTIPLPIGQDLRSLVITRVDGQLICVPHAPSPATVWSIAPGRAALALATNPIPDSPEFAMVPLNGAGRIALVSPGLDAAGARPPGATPGPMPSSAPSTVTPPRKVQIVEISVSTGQVLFSGNSRREAAINPGDLQALALAIGVLTAAVFLFVLRQDNKHVVRIPPRTSLATPARRFTGAMIDLVLAYAIAAFSLNMSMVTILTQGGPNAVANVMTLVVVTLLCAAIHSTIGEWLTGRSAGKFFTGSVVTRAIVERGDELDPPAPGARAAKTAEAAEINEITGRPTPTRPPSPPDASQPPAASEIPPITFVQAGLRNLIRWTPPLAMLLAFDSNFRHPGDVLSRTVVIVPDAEDDEVEDDEI